MSELEAGLYWVKAYKDGVWEGLQWHGKWWANCKIGYEPAVVGPRIPSPDEPWVSVPVQPTSEQTDNAFWAQPHTDVNAVYIDMVSAAPEP